MSSNSPHSDFLRNNRQIFISQETASYLSHNIPTARHGFSLRSEQFCACHRLQPWTATFPAILASHLVFAVSREAHLCLPRSLPTQTEPPALSVTISPFSLTITTWACCAKRGAPHKIGTENALSSLQSERRNRVSLQNSISFELHFTFWAHLLDSWA